MAPKWLRIALLAMVWAAFLLGVGSLPERWGELAAVSALLPLGATAALGGLLPAALAGAVVLAVGLGSPSLGLELGLASNPREVLLIAASGPVLGYLAHLHRQLHAHRRVSGQARFDPLTGLLNRSAFAEELERQIRDAKSTGTLLAVLFVDLDRFKVVNDSFGHRVGDDLLRQIGRVMRESVRQNDLLGRLGGDEFTLALPGLREPESAAAIARKLLHRLNEPFEVYGKVVNVSASIGISIFPNDGHDMDTLLKYADSAMYQVKSAGKNYFTFSTSELRTRKSRELDLERRLRFALEDDEFELRYQPQFDLNTSDLVGFEALLRWRNPELGMVQPQEFVPIAEESGLIIPLGHWVLREVCHQAAQWQRAGFRGVRVAANVSALQFIQPNFVASVGQALSDNGLHGYQLELEITESLLLRNAEAAVQTLRRLQRLDVRTALDDFGTGYSSLAYLEQLPIHRLKIAQAFVAGVGRPNQGGGSGAIVEAICAMAHKLKKTVVAEGVETRRQLEFLKGLRCDVAQGFLLAPPLRPAEAEVLLRSRWKEPPVTSTGIFENLLVKD